MGGQPFDQRQDVTAGLTPEYAEFVLQTDDIETIRVQAVGDVDIILDRVGADLMANDIRVIISLAAVVHGDDRQVRRG